MFDINFDYHNVNPNVAKVGDASDPRRQGRSCTSVPQAPDNKGYAVSPAFPKGKKHGENGQHP